MKEKLYLDPTFSQKLAAWYHRAARVLPWRENKDPYRVWVSEIMLQQTRVHTVIAYYERFMKRFPDITSLAEADEEELLKLWEGLGYYSRAKNLHKTAKIVATEYGGVFPSGFESIRKLPGIGDYTAGTIAAICFNQPAPSVDGNILRVITRLTGSRADIADPATKLIILSALKPIYECTEDRGALIQSMMELGALVCVPNGPPKCAECPVQDLCKAHILMLTDAIPVKTAKNEKTAENLTVFIAESDGLYAVRKRPAQGLLASLFEFPNCGGHLNEAEAREELVRLGFNDIDFLRIKNAAHIFTHKIWNMRVFYFKCKTRPEAFVWTDLSSLALPSAFKKLI